MYCPINMLMLIMLPSLFRWNLAYTDAYADLLWEKNIVRSLKSTAEEQSRPFSLRRKVDFTCVI
jgi:hypothetical protein